MGSPITLSGFNSIDFNVILNAVMRQEHRPVDALEARKGTLLEADAAYGSLGTKLIAVKAAAGALSGNATVGVIASSNAPTSVSVGASTTAVAGRYDVVVNSLARAQVMASSSTAADADTTVVATGGTITLNGVTVTLTEAVTLAGLASAINQTDGIGVTASVSETAPGAFKLVLAAKETGASNAFTVAHTLGGSVSFIDTDNDGTSGDSAADNAVQASNASLLVNNIPVESASNTLTTAVQGLAFTLLDADPDTTVAIQVARDEASLVDRVGTFVGAFNDLMAFSKEALATSGPLGRDALMRSMRGELRAALNAAYGSGSLTRLAEVGVGFLRTGELTLDETALNEAIRDDPSAVASLFGDTSTGAFTTLDALIGSYTNAGGILGDTRNRLTDEVSRVTTRIADMEARLALRREALQRQFSAADQVISRLNALSGSLSSIGSALRSNGL